MPIDAKVRDLCWSPEHQRSSLDSSASALTAWGHANGWPAMTDEQARAMLLNEASAQRLRPAPVTPRVEAVEAVLKVYPPNTREQQRAHAEDVVKAIEAAGLTILRSKAWPAR